MVELTQKQKEGIQIAIDRYRAGLPYTCIAGYAGVGKSFTVRYLIDALGFNRNDVAYIAYTGQAAKVLKQKGNPNATTAHKLLYYAKMKKDGTYIFTPRTHLDKPYKMIVVDEVSMLPKTIWEVLLSHKIYVVALGDPGQLPPIYRDEDNHILDHPHVFLDEIMRQAKDSEIIRLSMFIRNGGNIKDYVPDNEQVQIYHKKDLIDGMYTWADQIICATNKTRNGINKKMRQMKGFSNEPQEGDKVCCLKNYWEFLDTKNITALTNGTTGHITYCYNEPVRFPNYIIDKPIDYLYAEIATEDDETFSMVPIDKTELITGKSEIPDRSKYLMRKNKRVPDPPFPFTYAYALTCWKAQGAQYNKVLLIEEGHPWDKDEHQKYLYTGITRAIDKLVIILND